jgi:hypothetical protein
MRFVPIKTEEQLDLQALHRVRELARRGCEVFLVPTDGYSRPAVPVSSILKAIARARDWYERIVDGEFNSVDQLARKSGLTKRYVRKILLCARLSPHVIESLVAGDHRPNLTLKEILQNVPLGWDQQHRQYLICKG